MLSATRWLPTGLTIPVLFVLMQERGLSLATIGLISGLGSAVVALLELPTGGLADALGRRPVLLVAGLFSLASMAIVSFAASAALFALAASPYLLADDLSGFYGHAKDVLSNQRVNNIVLIDPSYQQRVNTLLPGRIATDRVRQLDEINAKRAGIAVDEQEIEGEEDELVGTTFVHGCLQAAEDGHAIVIESAELAVDVGGFDGEPLQRLHRASVAMGPIEACPSQQLGLTAVDPGMHAVAVVLDLVDPVLARRRHVYQARELRLDPLW